MDWTLEVTVLPVTDLHRARDFYRDKLGFHVDTDGEVMPSARVVQLTPPTAARTACRGGSRRPGPPQCSPYHRSDP